MRSQAGSAQKDKGKIGDEKDKVKHLENKIEYLNNLIMEMKKQSEAKAQEPKASQLSADKSNEKILFLNQTITQLKEQNVQLNEQKIQLESDIQELLTEFANMKKKYETELSSLLSSPEGLQIPPNKKLVDIAYIEELEAEIKRLTEQQEFSERLEDIDKYKEVIAEKEKKISNLQYQLELYQVSVVYCPKSAQFFGGMIRNQAEIRMSRLSISSLK